MPQEFHTSIKLSTCIEILENMTAFSNFTADEEAKWNNISNTRNCTDNEVIRGD